ncbi:MAG: hypothetical protein U1D69_12825 [Polynucleobacter sp.]|uniref:hypothetical protein n=1 Tax=Limnobacter sp. TaxID=2003368 RepID=UPI002734D832|nr:hypothetical protein [Limnobacter sp.]MDP3273405.1 hypothetical protein [Limnobacter sp.]MDZ4057816.1 hypothetical protein [Polynucleobacter sp.]
MKPEDHEAMKKAWQDKTSGLNYYDFIEGFECALAHRDAQPAVAVNEQMLEVVKKHLSNLEAQEFENVRYDRCGDFAHYVCASCSARKLPNGEKEPHASTCGWFDRAESLKSLVAAAEAEAAKGGV